MFISAQKNCFIFSTVLTEKCNIYFLLYFRVINFQQLILFLSKTYSLVTLRDFFWEIGYFFSHVKLATLTKLMKKLSTDN